MFKYCNVFDNEIGVAEWFNKRELKLRIDVYWLINTDTSIISSIII